MVKWLGAYRTPNTLPVVLIVVIGTWVYAGTIQDQVVATVVTVRSRRPIAAARASIVGRRRTEVAGVEEVIWKASKGNCGGFTCSICSVC